MYYLSSGTDAKTVKGEKFGWKTFILYLAPHTTSGRNVCPYASKGCAAACLFTAGRGKFKSVREARIRKTKEFFENRKLFLDRLRVDIEDAKREAARLRMKPCFRLNGTSDIGWDALIIREFPKLQFYDYSKNVDAVLENNLSNYHLTFSRSEENQADCDRVLAAGKNVAVVFSGKTKPDTWNGYPVIDGDVSDLRFLDPPGSIVGLKAKGDARKDTSGFVVQL